MCYGRCAARGSGTFSTNQAVSFTLANLNAFGDVCSIGAPAAALPETAVASLSRVTSEDFSLFIARPHCFAGLVDGWHHYTPLAAGCCPQPGT